MLHDFFVNYLLESKLRFTKTFVSYIMQYIICSIHLYNIHIIFSLYLLVIATVMVSEMDVSYDSFLWFCGTLYVCLAS